MADYRKMYFQLCDAVERALEVMESDSESGAKLCRGQALLVEACSVVCNSQHEPFVICLLYIVRGHPCM